MKSLWDFLRYIFESRDRLWRELLDTQNKYRNAWKRIENLQRENAELKRRLGIEDEPEKEDPFSYNMKKGAKKKC